MITQPNIYPAMPDPLRDSIGDNPNTKTFYTPRFPNQTDYNQIARDLRSKEKESETLRYRPIGNGFVAYDADGVEFYCKDIDELMSFFRAQIEGTKNEL